jgi:bifunctional DNase/RNase
MKRLDLAGLAVEATSGSPLVLLREHDDPHRLLPIFVGGAGAAAIALAVSGQVPPRPLTHDLMASLVLGLDGHVDAVEVTELRDGAYFATLSVHGPSGSRRVDARPSDAIALAVRLGVPLFVAEAVLDEAGTLPPVEDDAAALDEATIDEAVDEFRSFLDEIDPSHFATGPDRRAGKQDSKDADTGADAHPVPRQPGNDPPDLDEPGV